MPKRFLTLIHQDDTSLFPLSKKEIEEKEAILSGAFSGEMDKNSSTLFSPTLRLNSELGDFTDHELLNIALLEKERLSTNIPRSYEKRFEPEIALISSSQEFIDDFISIYGGILDLVPIRLSLEQIKDLEIKRTSEKRLEVTFKEPFPIDPELCDSCRRCSTRCPQDAISPSLKIDFSRCDFCKGCIEVCERGAIDLHRIREKGFILDEIIVQRDIRDILPEFPFDIYMHDDLEGLFKKIGTFSIEEGIIHNVEYCSFDPRLKVGCKRCISFCKNNAIKTDERGIRIEYESCIECGNCVSACPTGGMELSRFRDESFLRYFKGLKARKKRIVIGHEKELRDLWWKSLDLRFKDAFFLEHPNPFSLNHFHLLVLFASGFKRIFILKEDKKFEGEPPIFKEISFFNEFIKKLTGDERAVSVLNQKDLIKGLREDDEKFNESPFGLLSKPFEGRRSAFREILKPVFSKIQKARGRIETEVFSGLSINDSCSLCLSCLNVCYQDALRASEKELSLSFLEINCTNCRACLKICPEKAISLDEGLFLSRDIFREKVLLRDEPIRCKRCGRVFSNKRSFERAIGILEKSGTYDQGMLSALYLCEDCRVRSMFEELLK